MSYQILDYTDRFRSLYTKIFPPYKFIHSFLIRMVSYFQWYVKKPTCKPAFRTADLFPNFVAKCQWLTLC